MSPTYWELLLFDILKELYNTKHSNIELEARLFGMIKNIDAI